MGKLTRTWLFKQYEVMSHFFSSQTVADTQIQILYSNKKNKDD